MNCANHVEVPAAAYCRTCGKPLCSTCVRDVRGVIFCEECLAAHLSGHMPAGTVAASPGGVPSTSTGGPSPGLAALLGLIPGVGAFYNGEYLKGFVHVAIFATLIALTEKFGLFGIAIAAFVVYMPIEAYQVAKARAMGVPPPDPLGLNNLFGSGHTTAQPTPPPAAVPGVPAGVPTSVPTTATAAAAFPAEECAGPPKAPIGALILVGLGILFLLNTMNLLRFDWGRFWPLILIAVGLWTLAKRNRVRS